MNTRPVIVFEWGKSKDGNDTRLKKEMGKGKFHKWGNDFEEFGFGIGNFSTAIVELPDGSVLNHPAELIQFTDV